MSLQGVKWVGGAAPAGIGCRPGLCQRPTWYALAAALIALLRFR